MAPRAAGPQPWKVLARSEATGDQAEQPPEEEMLEGEELDAEEETDGDDEELGDELPDDPLPLCEPITVATRADSTAL